LAARNVDSPLIKDLEDDFEDVPSAERVEIRKVGPTIARFVVASLVTPRLTETISPIEKVPGWRQT
jgi:hypothetical protein